MADIKIREGSLIVRMVNRFIHDPAHNPGQAVHIQFQRANGKPVGNYTFVNGKLVAAADDATSGPQLLDFSVDTEEWEPIPTE